MQNGKLALSTPRWGKPLLAPIRYKGAKGGRGSGKSHFFAEQLVAAIATNPDLSAVCIREVQRSLKFSAKKLIEDKIRALGVSHLFEITSIEIRRVGGDGVIIFQGMQNHTADSIKSLEGFKIAWVEEAQSISERSMKLLLPTIRMEGSEIWFSWNPDQETDPVDKMFHDAGDDPDYRLIHVNYPQNPFCPQLLKDEADRHLRRDPDSYAHVWLGQYNLKSDDQVLAGKCITQDFEPQPEWQGPYLGADWGFSSDPDTLVECYIDPATDKLYIRHELYRVGVEINDTPEFWDNIPNAKTHTVRADCARPEVISYMKHHGYPKTVSVEKWAGSVEDGISTLRGFEQIVIHSDCTHTAEEARLWKYKRDRLTDDVLPVLIDKHNHCWDAIRYALAPIIKQGNSLGDLLDMAMGR